MGCYSESMKGSLLNYEISYLDRGCPTFFWCIPTNLWDITQKRKDIQGPGRPLPEQLVLKIIGTRNQKVSIAEASNPLSTRTFPRMPNVEKCNS